MIVADSLTPLHSVAEPAFRLYFCPECTRMFHAERAAPPQSRQIAMYYDTFCSDECERVHRLQEDDQSELGPAALSTADGRARLAECLVFGAKTRLIPRYLIKVRIEGALERIWRALRTKGVNRAEN